MKPVWVDPERKEGQKHSRRQGLEDQERKSEVEEGENPQITLIELFFQRMMPSVMCD